MKDDRLISLNAAIDAVNNMIRRKFGISADLGTNALLQLPPAQPSTTDTNVGGTSDTISRQAAIKAICEDGTMLERQGKYTMTMAERKQKDADILDTLPSAQPEIIHCKDCKYNPNPPECGNADCVLFYGMTDQMGFCHHGERREQE